MLHRKTRISYYVNLGLGLMYTAVLATLVLRLGGLPVLPVRRRLTYVSRKRLAIHRKWHWHQDRVRTKYAACIKPRFAVACASILLKRSCGQLGSAGLTRHSTVIATQSSVAGIQERCWDIGMDPPITVGSSVLASEVEVFIRLTISFSMLRSLHLVPRKSFYLTNVEVCWFPTTEPASFKREIYNIPQWLLCCSSCFYRIHIHSSSTTRYLFKSTRPTASWAQLRLASPRLFSRRVYRPYAMQERNT